MWFNASSVLFPWTLLASFPEKIQNISFFIFVRVRTAKLEIVINDS